MLQTVHLFREGMFYARSFFGSFLRFLTKINIFSTGCIWIFHIFDEKLFTSKCVTVWRLEFRQNEQISCFFTNLQVFFFISPCGVAFWTLLGWPGVTWDDLKIDLGWPESWKSACALYCCSFVLYMVFTSVWCTIW